LGIVASGLLVEIRTKLPLFEEEEEEEKEEEKGIVC
jgi:hypothetical protein